jgi:hypothetical protein
MLVSNPKEENAHHYVDDPREYYNIILHSSYWMEAPKQKI